MAVTEMLLRIEEIFTPEPSPLGTEPITPSIS